MLEAGEGIRKVTRETVGEVESQGLGGPLGR